MGNLKRLSKSLVSRDVLASVSLDARLSPGPGSYIPQTQISPKQFQYTHYQRYTKNPFGGVQPRFDYEKEFNAERMREERNSLTDFAVVD